MKTLVAIPVFNEQQYVQRVINEVARYATDILVIDDGSTDNTPNILNELAQQHPTNSDTTLHVIRHDTNSGYGSSLKDAFQHAVNNNYDWLITMDCDEQHEPSSIPRFIKAAQANDADIISGSRYAQRALAKDLPPQDRRKINRIITEEINNRLNLNLTDAFCGFKAHRTSALKQLLPNLTETGYAFPMQLWVLAAAQKLRITELPVSLIYNDLNRSFGGPLDNPENRLAHYRSVLHCELLRRAGDLTPQSRKDIDIKATCAQCA